MELGTSYAEYQHYPYDDVDALVEDLLTGLEEDGVFEGHHAGTDNAHRE